MLLPSPLPPLCSAEQCQASIHTLWWTDRLRPCPRCQRHPIGHWGTYQYRPGGQTLRGPWGQAHLQRLTDTLRHWSKWSLPHGMLATWLLCCACSSRRIAREVGGHIRTSYRWCWGPRKVALSYELHRQRAGTGEADELYHTAGNKGQAKPGGKPALGRRPRGRRKKREPGRGHDDKDRSAISAWGSRQGAVVLHATKACTVKRVQQAANWAIYLGSRLSTDSASS